MALLYCYYGDDFTGSTDVLEQLAVSGVSSVLFLTTPSPEQLARFAGCQAIGFAGDARSQTPEWMSSHLAGIFTRIRELNPAVVVAARTMFELPHDDARLTVHEMDAWDFVNDRANHGTIGALQIDVYDATARGPVLDSVGFYRAVRACLTDAGVVTVNLFGDHPSFVRNMKRLNEAFDGRVVALPEVHDGNRIAIAFSGPALDIPFTALQTRAKLIEAELGLPARKWIKGLQESTGQTGASFTV